MKILLLANDESTIYNFRRELIVRLVNLKHEVHICYPEGERTGEIVSLGCKHINISLNRRGTNPMTDFILFIKYIGVLKKYKPDVVLTYTAKPNIYGSIACRVKKIPVINNVTGLGSVFEKDGALKRLMLLMQKFAYKKSKTVFFQNESNLNYFMKNGIALHNAKLLPGSGVNLQIHKQEKYPENEGVTKFVTVSRIRADKGFDELFCVAQKMENENVEFHVVGWYEDDTYKNKVNDLVENGIIVYHGKQSPEKVHEIIKNSHCMIHPSYHEGMANVLLECGAAGRPVIASNIPGCVETFDEGVTGYGFKVKDANDLYRAVSEFLVLPDETREEMGKNARLKIEKEFDRNIVIDMYLKEINEIIISH